jgi:hypothetical protein
MLTNTGKNILAKYLIGQTPAYASYIAFGCGAKPLGESDAFFDYSDKTSLDFEMFRAPIISRGYVSDVDQVTITQAVGNGQLLTCTGSNSFRQGDTIEIVGLSVSGFNIRNAIVVSATSSSFSVASTVSGTSVTVGIATKITQNIVFTAQLPTDERYEISEIGVYSAGSNPSAGPIDSRLLYSFGADENWEYHDANGATSLGDNYPTDLSKFRDGTAPDDSNLVNSINVRELVFRSNTDTATLNQPIRINRNERARFLNSTVFVRGDASWITGTSESNIAVSSSDPAHIHLNGISVNLDKNSGQDEVRVAFSILNKNLDNSNPSEVNIIIDFVSSDDTNNVSAQYARMRIRRTSTGNDFNNNRYFVASSKIEDLEKSSQFSWQSVNAVKIFVSIPTQTAEYQVSKKKIEDGVATLTFATPHEYNVGGRVSVSNVGEGLNGIKTITASTPTTISYSTTLEDLDETDLSPAGIVVGYSSQYYVALDAIRIENVATLNPLYGLVGYTVAKTPLGNPIVKESNTSSLLEFRFAMDVS